MNLIYSKHFKKITLPGNIGMPGTGIGGIPGIAGIPGKGGIIPGIIGIPGIGTGIIGIASVFCFLELSSSSSSSSSPFSEMKISP